MYAQEMIAEIHNRLQSTIPDSLVLLGGSYLYGEATEDSDLDFYAICRWCDLLTFQRYRKSIEAVKSKYKEVRCNITIVPRFLFKRGWYYVYGKDVSGKIHQSAIYPTLIIRNALKLAYYHYLRALVSDDLAARQRCFTKCAQQLAAALIFGKNIYGREPFFSLRNLIKQLEQVDRDKFEVLSLLLECRLNRELFSHRSTIIAERVLLKVLEFAYVDLKPQADAFLLSNYLLYNIRFVLKGTVLFLFKNPDKMVIKYLRGAIYIHENLKLFERTARLVVFPVAIV